MHAIETPGQSQSRQSAPFKMLIGKNAPLKGVLLKPHKNDNKRARRSLRNNKASVAPVDETGVVSPFGRFHIEEPEEDPTGVQHDR